MRLLSSVYAIEEAKGNLHDPRQRQTLNELVQALEIVNVRTAAAKTLPPYIKLAIKDRSIRRAALVGPRHPPPDR